MLITKITPVIFAGMLLLACKSSQKFQASTTVDKPLFAAINELNKHPENQKAQKDIEVFYNQVRDQHEETISVYQNSTDAKRWEKIMTELNAMQHIYNSILATPGATRFVKPKNYLQELQTAKEEAADDFYNIGNSLLNQEGREYSLQAYQAFKKSNQYVNGYKDVSRLMKEAYEKSVVNVVINPIEDENVFISIGNNWGLNDFHYRPEDYQQSLVRELGGRSSYLPARFFTDREARREGVDADWIVDVRWRDVDALRSIPHQYNRQVSRSVQVGSDTAGKPVYKTVYATLHITERTFSVRGDLDYRITNIDENSNVDHALLSDDVNWSESYATYSGDSRALSQEDWWLINNNTNNGYNRNLSKSDILNTLMRKLYPELKRRIQRAVEL